MELPLYHIPNLRTISILVWQRTLEFIKKAGSIILIVSILIWALSRLPYGDIESSFLADLGHFLAPIGGLIGLDWRMMVALLTSFIAKENSIATLGILFGSGEEGAQLTNILSQTLTPAAGLAFLVLQMLFIPCAATVAVIKQETGSWKWTVFNVGFMLIVSFLVSLAVYRLALFIGL